MSDKSFRKSFGFKIFMAFVLSALVAATVLSALLVVYQSSVVRRNLDREGTMLADMLAYGTRTWVFAENREMLKDAIQGVMVQENVLAVVVYNADKQVLIVERSTRSKSLPADRVVYEEFSKEPAGSFPRRFEKDDTIGFLSPVLLETSKNAENAPYFVEEPGKAAENIIGYVEVILDKGELRTEMKSILLRNALVTVLFLLAGSIAIYIAVRRIMRPLTDLAESVRALGEGRTVEKVPVETMDEIGRLATDFNAMSDSLEKREEEKKTLETKLRYAQKMEAVGTLARGIAHDFNNILAMLRGSIYLLDKKLDDREELRRYTLQAHDAVGSAQSLIRQLLAFSRTQQIEFRPVDLNMIVRRLRPMLLGIAGEGIDLQISFSETPVMVMSDSVQVEQILLNLCTNARDAMPDGGKVSITLGIETVEAGAGRKELPPRSGEYGLITVSDTGPGMDEKTKERIFEPYFTTKDVGKGSGLGLAIVYGIIKQHNGWIWVDSQPGQGSTFRVYFALLEKSGPDMENKSEEIS